MRPSASMYKTTRKDSSPTRMYPTFSLPLSKNNDMSVSTASAHPTLSLQMSDQRRLQSRYEDSVGVTLPVEDSQEITLSGDPSKWEAMEVRYIDNEGNSPNISFRIDSTCDERCNDHSLRHVDKPGLRRQTVKVEKVVISNLLDASREVCGLPGTSRLSEYKPRDSAMRSSYGPNAIPQNTSRIERLTERSTANRHQEVVESDCKLPCSPKSSLTHDLPRQPVGNKDTLPKRKLSTLDKNEVDEYRKIALQILMERKKSKEKKLESASNDTQCPEISFSDESPEGDEDDSGGKQLGIFVNHKLSSPPKVKRGKSVSLERKNYEMLSKAKEQILKHRERMEKAKQSPAKPTTLPLPPKKFKTIHSNVKAKVVHHNSNPSTTKKDSPTRAQRNSFDIWPHEAPFDTGLENQKSADPCVYDQRGNNGSIFQNTPLGDERCLLRMIQSHGTKHPYQSEKQLINSILRSPTAKAVQALYWFYQQTDNRESLKNHLVDESNVSVQDILEAYQKLFLGTTYPANGLEKGNAFDTGRYSCKQLKEKCNDQFLRKANRTIERNVSLSPPRYNARKKHTKSVLPPWDNTLHHPNRKSNYKSQREIPDYSFSVSESSAAKMLSASSQRTVSSKYMSPLQCLKSTKQETEEDELASVNPHVPRRQRTVGNVKDNANFPVTSYSNIHIKRLQKCPDTKSETANNPFYPPMCEKPRKKVKQKNQHSFDRRTSPTIKRHIQPFACKQVNPSSRITSAPVVLKRNNSSVKEKHSPIRYSIIEHKKNTTGPSEADKQPKRFENSLQTQHSPRVYVVQSKKTCSPVRTETKSSPPLYTIIEKHTNHNTVLSGAEAERNKSSQIIENEKKSQRQFEQGKNVKTAGEGEFLDGVSINHNFNEPANQSKKKSSTKTDAFHSKTKETSQQPVTQSPDLKWKIHTAHSDTDIIRDSVSVKGSSGHGQTCAKTQMSVSASDFHPNATRNWKRQNVPVKCVRKTIRNERAMNLKDRAVPKSRRALSDSGRLDKKKRADLSAEPSPDDVTLELPASPISHSVSRLDSENEFSNIKECCMESVKSRIPSERKLQKMCFSDHSFHIVNNSVPHKKQLLDQNSQPQKSESVKENQVIKKESSGRLALSTSRLDTVCSKSTPKTKERFQSCKNEKFKSPTAKPPESPTLQPTADTGQMRNQKKSQDHGRLAGKGLLSASESSSSTNYWTQSGDAVREVRVSLREDQTMSKEDTRIHLGVNRRASNLDGCNKTVNAPCTSDPTATSKHTADSTQSQTIIDKMNNMVTVDRAHNEQILQSVKKEAEMSNDSTYISSKLFSNKDDCHLSGKGGNDECHMEAIISTRLESSDSLSCKTRFIESKSDQVLSISFNDIKELNTLLGDQEDLYWTSPDELRKAINCASKRARRRCLSQKSTCALSDCDHGRKRRGEKEITVSLGVENLTEAEETPGYVQTGGVIPTSACMVGGKNINAESCPTFTHKHSEHAVLSVAQDQSKIASGPNRRRDECPNLDDVSADTKTITNKGEPQSSTKESSDLKSNNLCDEESKDFTTSLNSKLTLKNREGCEGEAHTNPKAPDGIKPLPALADRLKIGADCTSDSGDDRDKSETVSSANFRERTVRNVVKYFSNVYSKLTQDDVKVDHIILKKCQSSIKEDSSNNLIQEKSEINLKEQFTRTNVNDSLLTKQTNNENASLDSSREHTLAENDTSLSCLDSTSFVNERAIKISAEVTDGCSTPKELCNNKPPKHNSPKTILTNTAKDSKDDNALQKQDPDRTMDSVEGHLLDKRLRCIMSSAFGEHDSKAIFQREASNTVDGITKSRSPLPSMMVMNNLHPNFLQHRDYSEGASCYLVMSPPKALTVPDVAVGKIACEPERPHTCFEYLHQPQISTERDCQHPMGECYANTPHSFSSAKQQTDNAHFQHTRTGVLCELSNEESVQQCRTKTINRIIEHCDCKVVGVNSNVNIPSDEAMEVPRVDFQVKGTSDNRGGEDLRPVVDSDHTLDIESPIAFCRRWVCEETHGVLDTGKSSYAFGISQREDCIGKESTFKKNVNTNVIRDTVNCDARGCGHEENCKEFASNKCKSKAKNPQLIAKEELFNNGITNVNKAKVDPDCDSSYLPTIHEAENVGGFRKTKIVSDQHDKENICDTSEWRNKFYDNCKERTSFDKHHEYLQAVDCIDVSGEEDLGADIVPPPLEFRTHYVENSLHIENVDDQDFTQIFFDNRDRIKVLNDNSIGLVLSDPESSWKTHDLCQPGESSKRAQAGKWEDSGRLNKTNDPLVESVGNFEDFSTLDDIIESDAKLVKSCVKHEAKNSASACLYAGGEYGSIACVGKNDTIVSYFHAVQCGPENGAALDKSSEKMAGYLTKTQTENIHDKTIDERLLIQRGLEFPKNKPSKSPVEKDETSKRTGSFERLEKAVGTVASTVRKIVAVIEKGDSDQPVGTLTNSRREAAGDEVVNGSLEKIDANLEKSEVVRKIVAKFEKGNRAIDRDIHVMPGNQLCNTQDIEKVKTSVHIASPTFEIGTDNVTTTANLGRSDLLDISKSHDVKNGEDQNVELLEKVGELMNANKFTYNADSMEGKIVGDSSEVRDSNRKHIPKIDACVQTGASGAEVDDGNGVMSRVGTGVRTGCNAHDLPNQIGGGYQGMLLEAANGQTTLGGTVTSAAECSGLTNLIPISDEHSLRLGSGQASKNEPSFDGDQSVETRVAQVEVMSVENVHGNAGVKDQAYQVPTVECVHNVFEQAVEQMEFDQFYHQNSCSSASGNAAVVKPVEAYPSPFKSVNSVTMSYTQKRANHSISNITNPLLQAQTHVFYQSSVLYGMQTPSEFQSYASSDAHTHVFKRCSREDCITSHQFDTDETHESREDGKPHRDSFASTSDQFDSYASSKSAGYKNVMEMTESDTDCELDVLDATYSLSILNSRRNEQKYKGAEHCKEFLRNEKRQHDSWNIKSNEEFSFAQIPKYAFQGTSSINQKWSPKQYNLNAEDRKTKSIADATVAVFLKFFSHRFMASLVGHPRMKEQGDTGGMENKEGSMETPTCSCCGDQEPQIDIGVPNMAINDDVQNCRMPRLCVTPHNFLKACEVDKGSLDAMVVEAISILKESNPHCVSDCDCEARNVSDPHIRPEDGNGVLLNQTKESCRGALSPARGQDKVSSLSKNSQRGVQSSDTSDTISNNDREKPSVLFEHILNTMALDIQCYFDHLKKVAVACQAPQRRPRCSREPLYFRHESPPAQRKTLHGQIKDDSSHTPKNDEYAFSHGTSEYIRRECDLRPTKEEPPSSSSSSLYRISEQLKKERKLSSYNFPKPRPYPMPAAQLPFPSGHVLFSPAAPFHMDHSVNYSSGPMHNIPGMLIPASHVFCGDLIWNSGNVTRQVPREGVARTIKDKTFSENTSCTRKHNTVREHELDTFNDLRSFTTEMQTSSSLSDSESLTNYEYVDRYGESLTDLETDSSKSCVDYEMKRKNRKRSTIKRRAGSIDRQVSMPYTYNRRNKPRGGISCSSSVTPTEQFPGCKRVPCKSSIRRKKRISCSKLISVCKDEIDQADIQQKVKSIISMSLLKFMTDVLLVARGSRDVMESEITGKTPKLVEYTSRSSQENNTSRKKRNSFNTLRDAPADNVTPLPKAASDENMASFQHNSLYEKSPVKPKLNASTEHAVNADTKTNKNITKWSSHDRLTNARKWEIAQTQYTTSVNGGTRESSSFDRADRVDANRFWYIRRPVSDFHLSSLLNPNAEGVPAGALCRDGAQSNESRDEHDKGNIANGCGPLDRPRIMEKCRLDEAKKDKFFHCEHCYGYERDRELPPNINKTRNDGSPNISFTPYIYLKDDPALTPKEVKNSSNFDQLLHSVGFRETYDGHDFQGGDNPKSVGTTRVFEKSCENVGTLSSIMKIGTRANPIYPSSPKNLPKRYSPCGRYSKKKIPFIENAPRGKEKSVEVNGAIISTFGLKKHASGGCIGATEDVFDSHITRLSEIRSDMHAKFEDVFECKNVSKSLPPKINTSNCDVNTRNGNKKALSVIVGENRTPIKELICRYDNNRFESSCENARTNERGSVGSDVKPQGTELKKESQAEVRNISTLSSFLDNIHCEDGWNKCWSVGTVGWASKKTQQNNLEEQPPSGIQSCNREASVKPMRSSVSEDSVLKSKSQDEDQSQSNIGDKSDATNHSMMVAIKGNAWREFKSRNIVIDPLQPCDIDRAYAENERVTRLQEMNNATSTFIPGIGNNEALSVLPRRLSIVENVQCDTRTSLLIDVRDFVEPEKPIMSLFTNVGETKEVHNINRIGLSDPTNPNNEAISSAMKDALEIKDPNAVKRLNAKCDSEYTVEENALQGTKTEIEGFPRGKNKEWTRLLEKEQIAMYSKDGDEKDLSPTNVLNDERGVNDVAPDHLLTNRNESFKSCDIAETAYRQRDTPDSPRKNQTFQEDCATLGEKDRQPTAPKTGALSMGEGVDRKGRQSADCFNVAESIVPSSILISRLNNPLNRPNTKTYVSGNSRDYSNDPYESLYIDSVDSTPVLNIRQRMAKLYGCSSNSDKLKNTDECVMDEKTRHKIVIPDNLFENGQSGHRMSKSPGSEDVQFPEKSCKEKRGGELMQRDGLVKEDPFSSTNMSEHLGSSSLSSSKDRDNIMVTNKQTLKTSTIGTMKPPLESHVDDQVKGISSPKNSKSVTCFHADMKDFEPKQITELHANTQDTSCQTTIASFGPQIQNPEESKNRTIPPNTLSPLQMHDSKEATQGSSIYITRASANQQPGHLRSVERASFSTGINEQPLNLGLNKEYATATPLHLGRRDILRHQNASGYSEDENVIDIEYFQTKPLPSCSLDSELQHAIETMSSTSRFKRNECKHAPNMHELGSSEQKDILRNREGAGFEKLKNSIAVNGTCTGASNGTDVCVSHSTAAILRNEYPHIRAGMSHTAVHPSNSPSTFGCNSNMTRPLEALQNRRVDYNGVPGSGLRILNSEEMNGPLSIDNTCLVMTTQRKTQDHDNDTSFLTHGEGVTADAVKSKGKAGPENIKERIIETKHPFSSPGSTASIPCNENKIKWSKSDPQFLSPMQMNDSHVMRIETLTLDCMGNILSPHLQGSDSKQCLNVLQNMRSSPHAPIGLSKKTRKIEQINLLMSDKTCTIIDQQQRRNKKANSCPLGEHICTIAPRGDKVSSSGVLQNNIPINPHGHQNNIPINPHGHQNNIPINPHGHQNNIPINPHGHQKDSSLGVLKKEKSKGSKEDPMSVQYQNNTTSSIPFEKKGRLLNSKSFCLRQENNTSPAALTKNICQVTSCTTMLSCPRFPLEGSLANGCEKSKQMVNASQRQMNERQELGPNNALIKRLYPEFSGLTGTPQGGAVLWGMDKRFDSHQNARGVLSPRKNNDWKGPSQCSQYTLQQVLFRDRSPLCRSNTDLKLETRQSSASLAKCAWCKQTRDKDVDLLSSMADSKFSNRSSKSHRAKRKKSHVLFPVEIKSGSPHQIVEDFKKSKVKPSQIPIDVYKLYSRGKGPFSPKVRTLTISGPLMNMNTPVFRHGVEEASISDAYGDLKPPPGYACGDSRNGKSDTQLEHEGTFGEGQSTGCENKPRWKGVMKKFVPFGKKKI